MMSMIFIGLMIAQCVFGLSLAYLLYKNPAGFEQYWEIFFLIEIFIVVFAGGATLLASERIFG